jgi:hypothetical protein
MKASASRKPSVPVPVVIQLAYNLTKNRQVGYNMAVYVVKTAVKELNLPLENKPEIVKQIIAFYDRRALPILPRH